VAKVRQRKITVQRQTFEPLELQEVFARVYSDNLWGGEAGEFCSGSGSKAQIVGEYCTLVRDEIASRAVRSVLDLGCGDFQVGQRIASTGVEYTGVDVVPALIERNTRQFGQPGRRFLHGDITQMELPQADLVLVRQVLQHLSNHQISQVLNRLSHYQTVLVTEHYPAMDRRWTPNVDKPHGPDTRVIDRSAVVLDRQPFAVAGVREILRVPANIQSPEDGETIRTFMIERSGGAS
jgi:SAM-dependent methyltransferase